MLAHVGGAAAASDWSLLTLWSFDPIVLVVVLLPGVLYARGMRRWRNRPSWYSWWRPYAFYGGLASVFLALCSPIDGLADDLFMMHMLQHLIFQMAGPPLILLGAPTTPVLLGMPRSVRQRVVRPIVSNAWVRAAYNAVTYPPAVWLLFTINAWSWHLYGGAYDAALSSELLHEFQHFTFAATAMLLWWTIIDPRPLRSRIDYPFRALLMLFIIIQNVALGAAITFRKSLLYSSYSEGSGLWGLTPLGDQQSGGALMWVGGDTITMVALVAIIAVWWDRKEKQDRKRELAEDAARGAPAAAQARPAARVTISRPAR
ncbi:MAG: cytochrome c oxidase assembly protein [Dehalococcoidia bacterium]|nr:cytochrome c oxidase assembly protein [Dehalococcoidia bacterium]